MRDAIRDLNGLQKRYAERDIIGVEDVNESHRRGINAELAYIRGQADAQLREHNGLGVHASPQIARAFISYVYDELSGLFVVSSRSYLLGDRGSHVATVTRLLTGRYRVELASSPGGGRLWIDDACTLPYMPPFLATQTIRAVTVRIDRSTVTANTFELLRYELGPTGFDPADGEFAVLVYAG